MKETRDSGNFDDTARNIAESIDSILTTERSGSRRLELIAHAVRRALNLGFRAGIASRRENEKPKIKEAIVHTP
jgi:hypothetical protein